MAAVALSKSHSTLLSQLAANAQRAAAGELTQARDALNLLESSYPRSGILQQQLGEVHRSLGDGVAALNAFRRAVQLNDALADGWSAL